jgi:hypothetical protein
MRRFLVVAMVGLLAACGSSGGSSSGGSSGGSDTDAYVDAAMKSYDDASSSVKDTFNRTQAECLVRGIVDAVGVDKLKSNGIEPGDLQKGDSPFKSLSDDLSQSEAEEVAAVITDGECFDFADIVIKQLDSGTSNPFGKLTRTQLRCFFGELLKEKAVKKALAASILGQDSSNSALQSTFSNQSKLFSILGDCNIRPSQLNG